MKAANYAMGSLCIWCLFMQVNTFAAPKIKAFDCPVILYDNLNIVQPNCGNNDGSILGVTAQSEGTKPSYIWRDKAGNIVSRASNLTGVGQGTYRLEVTDNSGCTDPVYSRDFVLESLNVIKIFDGDAEVGSSTCNSDGFIKGLVVTGATLYTWKNTETNKEYTSTITPDLFNSPAGTYILTASNDKAACAKMTQPYIIRPDFELPDIIDFTIAAPNCSSQTANIAVKLRVTLGGPELTWYYGLTDNIGIASEGRLFGNMSPITAELKNAPPGAYSLYVKKTDGGCPIKLASFPETVTELAIDVEKSSVFNDRCNQHRGSVTPVLIGLPSAAPKGITYTWTNLATGKVVGQLKRLSNAAEGRYEFVVELPPTCFARHVFTITNTSWAIIPPKADGTTLCLPGTVHIVVTNPDTAAIFKLYASEQESVAIDSNATGEFYRAITKTTDFYISRKHGECESERTKIVETVVFPVNIPNTFTPNNDGVNDYWKITGIESFPYADIKIFDRYGQMVFSSIGYGSPFYGQSKGRQLPAGVYYYMIDLRQQVCFDKISGNLTILH
ncbi:gliding motility-associated C-terminal domain-containing protein [Mucilaginibacter sp.]|uniref:gliding motility-associated C-terminal domain-containing protein n=1 Tax=Mucilaginibacter sp. TaxID=1882438 RepID=UPI00326310A0